MYENVKLPWPEWRIIDDIGEGGYGKVYKIRRTQAGITEDAALKVVSIPKNKSEYESLEYSLKTARAANQYIEKKKNDILKEVMTMQKLKGTPNIVDIDDWAILDKEDGPGWHIYIRMELLTPFFTKYSNIRTRDADVISLGTDICTALKHCEKRNFIHRDIKPGNILINDHGDHKLADFGIARTLDHTTYVTGVGTPAYMSPEIYSGAAANKTVDLYSLGLVMYELLNEHRLPFVPRKFSPRDEQAAITRRINGERIPEPLHGSPALKKIVLKACEYDAKDRYSSAAEMLRDLEKLDKGREEQSTDRQKSTFREDKNAGRTASAAAGGSSAAWADESKTVGADDYVKRQNKNAGEQRKTVKPVDPPKPPKPKPDKKKLIIIAVAAALIVGAIAAVFILKDKTVVDPPEPPEPPEVGVGSDPEPGPETETESSSMFYGGYYDPATGSMVKDPDLYTEIRVEYNGDEIVSVGYYIHKDINSGSDNEAVLKKLEPIFKGCTEVYSGRITLQEDSDYKTVYVFNDGSSTLKYNKFGLLYVQVDLQGDSGNRSYNNLIENIDISDDRYKLVESAGRMGFTSNYFDLERDPDRGSQSESQSQYKVGEVYKLLDDMKVRKGPSKSAEQLKRSELTDDAKKHALKGEKACLKKGTEVTCKEIQGDWMRIPSGWICCRDGDEVYVK